MEKKYFCPHVPKVFMPPVCDTLRIVKDIGKGKTPLDSTASASAHVSKIKKAIVEVPREENPSLYEIGLQTQQALENHIKLDRKVKLEMIVEINLLHNPERDRHVEAVRRVLEEVGAANVETLDVFNKCDLIGQGEVDRLRRVHPDTLCISALKNSGRAETIEAIAERLELDTRRVMLEFDEANADDRERIARVYRHARVLSHVTSGGRVAIEADVPRRVLDRVKTAGER
jgi:hypothetical protein